MRKEVLTLSSLLPILRQWNDYRKLLALPASGGDGDGPARLPLIDAAKPLVLAGLQHDLRRPLVVVTGDGHRAIQLFEQLKTWSALSDGVLLYPENEALPYESSVVDLQGSQERINALDRLVGGEGNDGLVVIVPARALMRKTIGPRTLRNLSRKLKVGDGLVPDGFLKYLLEAGYRPALVVDESGCFSRRGGIVDVFPPSNPVPVRIELFGDEIDTIREYDPSTQRTIRTVERVLLPPAEETAGVDLGRICEVLSGIDTSNLRPEVMAAWRFDLERLQSGQRFDRAAFYCAPFLESNLMDYLPSNSVLVLDEPLQVESIVNDLSAQAEGLRAELVQLGELPADFPRPYLDWSEIGPTLRAALRVDFPFGPAAEDHLSESHDGAAFSPQMMYGGKLKTLLEKSRQMARQGAVVIVSQQARRIGELFQELGVGASVIDSLESLPTAGSINLLQGAIQEGFSFQPGPEGDVFFVLSDAEVFGWAKQRRIVRRKVVPREVFLSDIEPGQFVVHVEHGIGRFLGMEHLAPDGVEREYLVIEYAENDKLYVPVDQLDRVSKYVGAGDQIPNVSRLGATDWLRTRERVRTATRQVARELLAVYAAREVSFGHAFQPDAPWQKELEDSFPYVETPDQIRAIEETKSDMEKPKPMDRLICGDVGYGKTEVALRAAFKAVMDGKQVAILVPTTVLAQQHFTTFTERMQAFPVRVEMLSRFRSDKEQKAVIEALKDGSVDICIGTHRLIQKDVSFKDLGLVIIDEEQRFGVMHKERLKRLRTEVDVLTLTATPIPRTLYMAIAGVRDMSTMETPPEERLPIRTFVAENNDHLVREAILREMDRGGQAYFVHNRVQSISLITRRLAELVPEAIISVGHGQMPDEQLEKVMFDFAAGKSDVLVCSTIIESGLDIPNVNTLIVNHADRFGLAQLYQLRGRVGRGANRAYAYFLYSKDKRLTPISEKRLRTISEATELGSGFRIAMKDLEIRGAGNLLGAEQHGHVSAVGFDLYCRLLADAVSLLKGEPVRHVSDVTMDVPLVALIPQTYVPDDPVRLSLYQRLANAESREQVGNIVLEMTDRFGPPPEPASNLAS
ncbi:MAG: transcription-repair coupling factor, partial [Chloroflexi bacterium]|nr:transcription-repair coupling factor [Chloroflexota bacterium]